MCMEIFTNNILFLLYKTTVYTKDKNDFQSESMLCSSKLLHEVDFYI